MGLHRFIRPSRNHPTPVNGKNSVASRGADVLALPRKRLPGRRQHNRRQRTWAHRPFFCEAMLDLEFLHNRLSTLSLGHPIHYQYQVTSTQDVAREKALRGAEEGLLVLAEEQTAGRGRAGRTWWSPPGTAILSSLLLRPQLPPTHLGYIGMIAGLAVIDALTDLPGLEPTLKWPNDILLHGKKLGGILVESLWEGDELDALILGLGLNVNTYFPPTHPLAGEATSIFMETGHPCAREPLIYAYVFHLSEYYHRIHQGWSPVPLWKEHLETLGQRVWVDEGHTHWEGIAEDVTETGELVLRRDGERVLLRVGDVRVRHR